MTRQDGSEIGVSEDFGVPVSAAVYAATDAAIDAIEKAYVVKVAQVPGAENKAYEVAYVAKAAAKVTVYEIASRAISSMAVVATDKRAAIAAAAIATIRQIQWS